MALLAMVRRNRRRYGGYIVHVGIAVLFIGVAASATFQHEQSPTLGVGQSVHVGAYTMRYEHPTGSLIRDPNGTGATLTLGAALRVSRAGRYVTTLHPSAGYYRAGGLVAGHLVSSLISGTAVSMIGLDSTWRRDLWAAVKPAGAPLPEQTLVSKFDAAIPPSWPAAKQLETAYIALDYILGQYLRNPPPANFTLLASPLVMWIWIGGLIVLGGGLIAIWPPPAAMRSRVRSRYLARVAQELGRA
jgi:cytochrome c-type biogenesis protein CcmF